NAFRGGGGNDILLGLDGNDTLFASGNGRNILVGGIGADTLTGGDGEDILLADSFAHGLAPNDPVLRALLALWARPRDYATRTAALNHDGVLVDGVAVKLNSANVQPGDGAADTVYGSGGFYPGFGSTGLDWYWTTNEDVSDRIAGQDFLGDV